MSSLDDIALIESKLNEFCASPEPDLFLVSVFRKYLHILKEVGYDELTIKDNVLVPVINNPKEEYTGPKVEYKIVKL